MLKIVIKIVSGWTEAVFTFSKGVLALLLGLLMTAVILAALYVVLMLGIIALTIA